MKYIFLTNDPLKANSNQRSLFFYKFFKESASVSELNVLTMRDDSLFSKSEVLQTHLPFAGDIEFGIYLETFLTNGDKDTLATLEKLLEHDCLIVDNIYVAPLAIAAKKIRPEISIIYISHNAEANLKSCVASMLRWPRGVWDGYFDFIKTVESEIIHKSDLVLTCSNEDSSAVNYSLDENFLVVPNGAFLRTNDNHKGDIFSYLGCTRYVLFVASGHPPNFIGFLKGIGKDFGFMPPDTRIVIVGSSARYISDEILNSKFAETFLIKGSAINYASDDLLAALYEHATAVILPIFEGGGTNIKTAEAFLNSRLVISSSFALRGFDLTYWGTTKLRLANNQLEFKEAILGVLTDPIVTDEKVKTSKMDAYSWDWIRLHYGPTLDNFLNKMRLKA